MIRLTLAMARRIAALLLIKVEVFGLVRFFLFSYGLMHA